MYALAILLVLNALVIDGSATGTIQQEKPVTPEPINTHFKAPPDTLSEMIAQAELVVRGRVVGGRPRDHAEIGLTRTAHRVKVLEVIRDTPLHAVTAAEIEVVRTGGQRDKGSYIENTYQVGFPGFENGHEYLLFLVWNKTLDSWVPAYGPDSALDLTAGIADSAGKSETVRRLKGKKATEVLDVVRRGGR